MRSHSYLNTAQSILAIYDGKLPLAAWLKNFFKQGKKYGSSDRRQVTHLLYSFYRLGRAFETLSVEERLLTGLFLCSTTPQFILAEQRPEWNEKVTLPLQQKLNSIAGGANLSQTLFPFVEALSHAIDADAFATSFLVQPDLFLRTRRGRGEVVKTQLREASIDFSGPSADAIQLANGVKVESVVHLNKDAVVQDLSSQKVLDALAGQVLPAHASCWDCCAASGGKSILAYDLLPNLSLTATDVRESILINLRKRLPEAQIEGYRSFVADVAAPHFTMKGKYDLVICDAPCSGSGTWARTPEQLHFFTSEKIHYYTDLQSRISSNAVKAVKQGGYFVYITCSVFRAENEAIVSELSRQGLELLDQRYIKGYEAKADTLFTALFRRS